MAQRFHAYHQYVELSEDRTVATKPDKYFKYSGQVFTAEPLTVGKPFKVRILDKGKHGFLDMGVTTMTPEAWDRDGKKKIWEMKNTWRLRTWDGKDSMQPKEERCNLPWVETFSEDHKLCNGDVVSMVLCRGGTLSVGVNEKVVPGIFENLPNTKMHGVIYINVNRIQIEQNEDDFSLMSTEWFTVNPSKPTELASASREDVKLMFAGKSFKENTNLSLQLDDLSDLTVDEY